MAVFWTLFMAAAFTAVCQVASHYRTVARRARIEVLKTRIALGDRMAQAWEEGHDACCGVYLRHCATARNPYVRDGEPS